MKIDNHIALISTSEVTEEFGEAVASLAIKNPDVLWAKFILTDDLPNGNGMRIPREEFENIIKSGVHMPIKMTEGAIEDHDGSKPLGVISHLAVQDNKIMALAALWLKERPSDVEYIKQRVKANEPVDVSWEVAYDRIEVADGGVFNLLGTHLSAATIVRDPAYKGRTPFIAVAAMASKWGEAYINNLPDSSFLYVQSGGELDTEGKTTPRSLRHFPVIDADGNVDRDRLYSVAEETVESNLSKKLRKSIRNAVDILDNRFEKGLAQASINKEAKLVISSLDITEDTLDELKKLEGRVEELEAKLEEKTEALKEATSALSEKETALSAHETELAELKEFKQEIEAEAQKLEKLSSIKTKFEEAKIEKDETYFTENAESLLALDENTLNFMLQEMVAFSENSSEDSEEDGKDKTATSSKAPLPNFTKEDAEEELSISDLAKFLQERNAK